MMETFAEAPLGIPVVLNLELMVNTQYVSRWNKALQLKRKVNTEMGDSVDLLLSQTALAFKDNEVTGIRCKTNMDPIRLPLGDSTDVGDRIAVPDAI